MGDLITELKKQDGFCWDKIQTSTRYPFKSCVVTYHNESSSVWAIDQGVTDFVKYINEDVRERMKDRENEIKEILLTDLSIVQLSEHLQDINDLLEIDEDVTPKNKMDLKKKYVQRIIYKKNEGAISYNKMNELIDAVVSKIDKV